MIIDKAMQMTFLTGVWFYLLLLTANFVMCTEYTVIKINGKVTYQNKLLKLGDRINVTRKDHLSFGKDASIQVCAPGCQPASLEINITRENSLASLVNAIRSQLAFNSKPRTTARRGEDYHSLQQWFAASNNPNNPNPFLIIDQGEYPIYFPQFVQSLSRFFSLKYIYQGQTIYKKLPYNGNRVIMNYTHVYTVDGKIINPSDITNMQLIYLDNNTNQETYICHFQPVFIEPEALVRALTPVIKAVASQTSPEVLYADYIIPFVLYNFGLPEENSLKELLRQKFNISFP